jgi:hypothetical protein
LVEDFICVREVMFSKLLSNNNFWDNIIDPMAESAWRLGDPMVDSAWRLGGQHVSLEGSNCCKLLM